MTRVRMILCIAALLTAGPVRAQFAPPNGMGISMGHVELLVQDVDAARKFFLTLGGAPTTHGTGVKFPTAIIIFKQGTPSGGAMGSVINHFGFQVQNLQESVDKWKAAGLKTEPGTIPGQAFVYTPDGLARIEMLENKDLKTPIVFHHIHWFVPSPGPAGGDGDKEVQAWYAKVFGAIPGKRAIFEAADLPGVNLTFSKSPTPTVPTKGRSVDQIGFTVSDLKGFCEKETAQGVKFDTPCAQAPKNPIYMTDPWGVTIELNDGHRM
jgi:catechol 2,3-dioxygenase-like lactoylglutathione lyase family enzyme